MGAPVGWLCSLIIGLIAFAAVGHFMWWLMATILHVIFDPVNHSTQRPTYRPLRGTQDCPACAAACEPNVDECPCCGLVLASKTAKALKRVRTAETEVNALATAGELDPDTAKAVAAQLRRRARVLQGLSPDPLKPVLVPEPPLVRAPEPIPAPVAEPVPASVDAVPEAFPVLDSSAISSPPAEPPTRPEPVTPPEPPRHGSVLTAFMEERNILWGELVGGLLIVGCSIALLVTLWHRLEAFPYFPFLLSGSITLALYGAGQYTLHHWKLTATSLGLLVISLLLAPLDLLLLSDPITRSELSFSTEVGVKVLAVVLFAWVVRGGGRDVLTARTDWRWWLSLAVIGPPAMQLLPSGWFASWTTVGPAWLALACFAGPCLLTLRRLPHADVLDRASGSAVLQFVGLAVFALAAAWGLHVARSLEVASRVVGLAVPLVLAGAVVVEAGLIVAMRVKEGGPRVTGTAVALAGVLAMTAGFVIGWSDPLSVLLGAAFAGLFFNRMAFVNRIPAAIGLGVASLALAIVIGYFGIVGRWNEPLGRLLGTSECGAVLTAMALVLTVIAEVLARRRFAIGPVSYALSAAGVGCAGLFLVSANGLQHPLTATAAHAACAMGLLASNVRWRLRVVAHGGLWVMLIGSLWALYAGYPGQLEKWAFVVSVEALGFATLSLGIKGHRTGAAALLRRAGRDLAIAATILAPVLAMAVRSFPNTAWDTGTLFVLAFTPLAIARLTGVALATYFGAASAFLGFVHLATVTLNWEPDSRALLVGMLTHATLFGLAAVSLRRLERVFAYPLRTSAMFTSLLGGLFLFAPPFGHDVEWAVCAVWLGLVWLTFALVWRQRISFAVFQLAFSLAAVLFGVAWIDLQGWWPSRSIEYLRPTALHVYAVALSALGIGWVCARHLLRKRPLAQQLWTLQTWSAERVVLAVLVAGQFLLASVAIISELQAELNPIGRTFHRLQHAALAQVFGAGVWAMLGMLALTLLLSWRLTGSKRDTNSHVFGLMLVFLSVPVVWAGTHAPELASASALRWGLGIAFALGTATVSLRTPLHRGLEQLGFACHTTAITRPGLLFMLAAAAGVVVFLSAQVAEIGLTGKSPSGPIATSDFAAMGTLASNLVPLVLVVLGLGCSAARERSPGYAFTGGLTFTATIAAGYALAVITGGEQFDARHQLRVWLLASSGAGIWALAWLASERRVTGGLLLAVQSRLGVGLLAYLAGIAAYVIVKVPEQPVSMFWAEFGQLGGFTLGLTMAAAVWRAVRTEHGLKFHALALSSVIASVMVACAVQPADVNGEWLSFHVLAGSWALVGVGLAVVTRKRGESSYWLDGMAAVLALLALRAGAHDPWGPWMPAALALVASFVAGVSAVLNRDSARVVVSGLLINFGAILLWLPSDPQTNSGFLLANAAGLAIAAIVWTGLARRDPEVDWRSVLDVTRGVALVLLWVGLFPTLAAHHTDPQWLVWVATLAVIASLWQAASERGAFIPRVGAFATGAVFFLIPGPSITVPVWDLWQTPLMLAIYALVASILARVAIRYAVTRSPEQWDTGRWLVIAQGVLGGIVIGLGVRLGLTLPDVQDRTAASPFSVLLLLGAAALLLRAVPTCASVLRFAVVTLGVLVVATTAWTVPDPTGSHPWLHRNAWLFVALAATGVLGTELARRLGEGWSWATKHVGGVCVALAVLVLGVSLVHQVPVFDPTTNHTPLEPAAVFAMLLGVLAIIVLAIRWALRRDLDPLALPDHRRTLYVYLAEMLVVLFFLQIRFNVPELFLAAAVRYWTFAVMLIAFVVVGLAELFERRKLDVLATPLRRTGVLVPLIPLLAFWIKPPAFVMEFATGKAPGLSPLLGYLEKLPQHFDTYAWLWFLAGGLYGILALARNSFGWALLAALATNAALWSLLTHHQIPFVVHPQAWVIPLALTVLISEHINRAKLSAEMSNGLRYLGVGMIYIASSADMFIAGVGQSVWLPVILAVFCVAGVLAGIMMRVRAFLFLGVGFLILDIFAMIWHAAVDLQHTWVWYVSGIILGVAILTLFAVFEKRKRHDATG